MLPEWAVMDLPYAFVTEDAVQEAFQGEIGRMLFEGLEKRDMKGLAIWGNGFKQMTSNRGPLLAPSDFAGQRFRILPSRIIKAEFDAFGAHTAEIPFNEVYRELEAGNVDGGENTITNIYSKKFYKVQKYMTISNHAYLGYAVLINKPFWDRLPPELQTAVEEAMQETSEWVNRYNAQMDNQYLEKIEEDGHTQIHVQTDGERAEWMRRWEPVYRQADRLFGQELMQAVRDLRRKYGG
jgi:C4-dicarboxylate-binding protein DctP